MNFTLRPFVFTRAIIMCLSLLFAARPSSAAPAEAPRRVFDVPADDSLASLKIFAQQCGQEIIYPPDKVKGTRTNAVKGEFVPKEALDQMLAGTGLIATEAKSGVLTVNRVSDANTERSAEASPASAGTDDAFRLDSYQVTVTVQKRPQSVQDVPISMTTLIC